MLLSCIVLRREIPFPPLPQRLIEGNQGRCRRVLVATVDAIPRKAQPQGGDDNSAERQPLTETYLEPRRSVVRVVFAVEGELESALDPPELLLDAASAAAEAIGFTRSSARCKWAVVKPFSR